MNHTGRLRRRVERNRRRAHDISPSSE